MTEEQAIGELFERLWQMRKSVQRCMQQVEGRCPHSQFFMLERLHYAIRQRGEGGGHPGVGGGRADPAAADGGCPGRCASWRMPVWPSASTTRPTTGGHWCG